MVLLRWAVRSKGCSFETFKINALLDWLFKVRVCVDDLWLSLLKMSSYRIIRISGYLQFGVACDRFGRTHRRVCRLPFAFETVNNWVFSLQFTCWYCTFYLFGCVVYNLSRRVSLRSALRLVMWSCWLRILPYEIVLLAMGLFIGFWLI